MLNLLAIFVLVFMVVLSLTLLVLLWQRSSGEIHQRIWAALDQSKTIALSYLIMIPDALLGILDAYADLAGDPEFHVAISSWLPANFEPKYAAINAFLFFLVRHKSLFGSK